MTDEEEIELEIETSELAIEAARLGIISYITISEGILPLNKFLAAADELPIRRLSKKLNREIIEFARKCVVIIEGLKQ